ncbi:kynureninase [Steroidobacter sp. S1-65]|uniref:Kynureninase n=1 Tax=Steroidobacter gossypii TaxID=2805490 RepID=A0ABS1X5I2_9GAMM|nr:kynureninase [Steroidobacter gossypii]MBM0108460.1 kynureninase [Steroidobacter gossypii]
MNVSVERSFAVAQDAADSLAPLRAEFFIPKRSGGGDSIYLCGHSLGLQPRGVARVLNEELEHWEDLAVEGHFASSRPWLPYHEQLTSSLAKLAGAQPLEVVAMNSLTVNLHLMFASFYRPRAGREAILIEQRAFSSDQYAVASQIRYHGFDPDTALIEIAPRSGEDVLRTEDICALIEREGQRIATVMLPGVQYLTGQRFDLEAITRCARRQGCVVGFDLAHAMGNVPLRLHDWDVDFAVWCSYKYLNAGPGAIGGCFVHERHAHAVDLPRFAGWWGHDKSSRFQMPSQFQPIAGAEGWQLSNPPILAAAPLLASLPLFDTAGMDRLREKSLRLTAYLESQLQARLSHALNVITPTDPEARGCQLSIRLHRSAAEARAVFDSLAAAGVFCDWREPDIIRVAPVPLYNSFVDVWEFVAALERALQ